MTEQLLYTLIKIGHLSGSAFWFPLTLWTVLAIAVTWVLRRFNESHSIYQYHGRVALLFALPLGLLVSYTGGKLGSILAPSENLPVKFLVIQSPLAVSAVNTDQMITWFEPALWLGIAVMAAMLVTIGFLLKVGADFIALQRFSRSLDEVKLKDLSLVSPANINLSEAAGGSQAAVAFSHKTQVPFTFGWITTTLVFPEEMKYNAEKFNMALRHELMHVKHRDYLLNNLLVLVKSIFWFHPLVHRLYRETEEYREITCDSEVLADSAISRKGYAELLYELAPRPVFQNSRTMSMAVNPSTLKKRIQFMKNQTYSTKTFRNSLALAFASALIIAGVIACSDIQNPALTSEDVAEVQRNLSTASPDKQPLYIINGVQVDMANSGDIISRIKKKYIQSVTVLKNEQAIEKYGQAGKNGVVKLQLVDEEAAFNDLLPSPPPAPTSSSQGRQGTNTSTENLPPPPPVEDYFNVVEDMPKLKGGLASLQKNIRYPEEARDAGIQGRVVVQFIVNEQGQVEDPKIVRGIGGGADEEALRVVRLAKFEPGRQHGEPVRVQYAIPMIFKLAGDDSKAPKGASSANIKKPKTDILNTLGEIFIVGY